MSRASERRSRRENAASARAMSEKAQYETASAQLKSISGFDGANQSTRRGWIYWPTLDTKRELDSYSRTELLRKSRWLRANFGLANRICSGLADLIGYLSPVSLSGDPKWDEICDNHWEDRANEAAVVDAAGQFGIRSMQIEINKSSFGDGDVLPVLIKGSTDGVMISNYEAHQICSPPGADKTWIDGVKINKFRRHVAYGLRDDDGAVKTISANDALYYSHPDTLGRIRPPTILAHAVNHMQDISEILADVKLTIKVAAQLGLYLENTTANPGGHDGARSLAAGLRDERAKEGDGTPENPPADYKVEDLYRANGGIANLPAGTKVGVIQDARPHPNQVALIEYLIRDISWGVGVSPDLLWNIKELGGANSRIANADLDRWISCRLLRLRTWLQRFRAIWISHEILAGRLPEPAGSAQYWRATFLPQASLTADKGKVGNLNISLVANEMRSLQTHFAEEGLYWKRELLQISKEKEYRKELGLALEEVTQQLKKAA
ncbi:MAG: phage portal protein [Luteolibacter sp.]